MITFVHSYDLIFNRLNNEEAFFNFHLVRFEMRDDFRLIITTYIVNLFVRES